METEVNTLNIKELARQAYEEDEQERIEAARRAAEREAAEAARALTNLLGNMGIAVEPTGRSITIDGITFRAVWRHYDWDIDMLMPYACWECHKDVWERIGNLADVHRKLVWAEENSAECEACHKKHLPPLPASFEQSPLEKLGAALTEYLYHIRDEG